MDAWEITGVLFGVVAVTLTVRENAWCWPTGLVNVLVFAVVFWRARLYADVGLQVLYAALCVYGWHAWRHGGRDRGALHVTRAPRRKLMGLLAGGAAFAVLLGAALAGTTDAAFPWLDSALASFSLVAQALQTRKWIENWWVWIAVDALYIGMYIAKELRLTAGLYAVFLLLAAAGLAEWRRSLERDREAQPGLEAA